MDRLVDFVINPAILLVFSAGFFLFIWGLVQFLWNLEGGEIDNGKRHMLWGIVGMVVMVSVYGIIAIIDNTFDLQISNPDVGRYERSIPSVNFLGN